MVLDPLRARELHPNWDIVDVVEAPNGGYWALGRDGGVFALNAEGGTTGTTAPINTDQPFSYTGLAPGDRMGTRTFEYIQWDPNTGRYTLVSNLGETYNFNTPTAPVGGGAGGGGAGDVTPPPPGDDTSGKDVFLNTLIGMGFTPDQANSLGGTLWTNSKTKSPDALYFDLINSTEYQARFPGMKPLRDQGMAISESQYITMERGYRDAARSAGLPADFYDSPDDFGKLITNGVSPDEYAARIKWGQTAALSDPTFIDELAREVPGFALGDAVAFFLDPDKGTDYLNQKVTRATYGTAARRNTFGTLTEAEKNVLQARGVTGEQAEAGFGQLGGGIMANTIEESMTDDQFTREEAVGYVAEAGRGGASTRELETRRARRAAQFGGGGGAAGGGGGKTGLG